MKQEFKAESRRILDLMINSIYTEKEIFLRELISNASDAIDKLRFAAASDGSVDIDPSAFAITLTLDRKARTLTVSDNGIGMDAAELADNLGVIAASGTKKLKESSAGSTDTSELIGQFGVGFYSAFMVADRIKVISRKLGSKEAFCWDCAGADGYTIEPAQKDSVGTDIILYIREEPDGSSDGSSSDGSSNGLAASDMHSERIPGAPDEKTDAPSDEFNRYLREYPLYKLVRKYSDYIRYPIRMLMPHPVVTNEAEIEAAKEAGKDIPEAVYSEVFEYETLNSMVPLWHRSRTEVSAEEYNEFYKEHFSDSKDPVSVLPVSVDGNISYKALLFIPSHAPADYNAEGYAAGAELYSSGVLIMKDCRAVLPGEFNFVRAVVDSSDLSLNISREMLQQDKQLKMIASGIGRRIRQELLRLLRDERDRYLELYRFFGRHLKVCAMDDYGAKKDALADLLLFWSGSKDRLITLDEYVDSMPEGQKYIYFAKGASTDMARHLPQTDYVLDRGFDVLFFTDQADDFIADMFKTYRDRPFLSITDRDPELDGGEAKADTGRFRETFDFIRETLGNEIDDVCATGKLKNHPVSLSSGSGVTFEMEKYFKAIHKDAPIKAKRILELNVHHPAFLALDEARISNPDRARAYCRILYNQAKMIAGLPIEDPGEYTDLIVSTWTK